MTEEYTDEGSVMQSKLVENRELASSALSCIAGAKMRFMSTHTIESPSEAPEPVLVR